MSVQTEKDILRITKDVSDLLISKNRSYGDSALEPIRVFSKGNATEQLLARIDDKLSRLQNGHNFPGDNDIDDLIGYLILLKISKERHINEEA